ncbi:hypothetical protein AX15_002491 [Amanita polypyramis BW_CC]|nr:hypothetical protein AX15_002491 [Amanita polypyramis BW_CC]
MPSVSELPSAVQKKYYNRPKFLLAPDPSTLATPFSDIVAGPDRAPSPSPSLELFGMSHTIGKLVTLDSCLFLWGDNPDATRHKETSSNPQVRPANVSIFPAPPTLEDIQRMEPDLSPESMLRRVGTIGGHLDNTHNSATPLAVARTELSAPYTITDGYSPIARPMKRCRTSSIGQGLPARDFIDIKCEVRFTRKRVRLEPDGFASRSRWYTEYLINLLTKTQFRDKSSTSTVVYDKLWRNILRLLWDFGLSESVVLLAFWYIRRIFPNGFMHPGMFSRSEGGMIAWRLFLLGNILAEKWLEDTTHPLYTWQPYFEVPLTAVKALERTVLTILDHNIYISNGEWQRWIEELQVHCQAEFLIGHLRDLQTSTMETLHTFMDDATVLTSKYEIQRQLCIPEGNSCQLVLDLLGPYYLEDRFEFTSAPLLLRARPHLTAWNPADDPIAPKRPQTFAVTPIARPSVRLIQLPVYRSSYITRFDPISNEFNVGPFVDKHHVPIMV